MKTPLMLRSLALSLFASLCLLAGCGDSGGITIVGISPSVAQTLDQGQTLNIVVSLVNDPGHQGATFSVSGGGTVGTPTITNVSESSTVSATYTPASTVTAATPITITATSVRTPAQSAAVTITVNPTLVLSTSSLATGTANVAYTQTLAATGGTGTLKWSLTSGTLPAGLALNTTTGVISGTPTAAGTSNVTIGITDSASTPMTATKALTIVINPQPPTVTTSTLPNGIAGTAYSQQLTSSGGGSGTATWAITTGSLPVSSGLTLSPSGLISGTPTNAVAGTTLSFSVAVTIGSQTSTSVALALTIDPLPTVATTSLPGGNVGIGYNKQLAYTGGAGGTVTWAISSGSLPAGSGLTLSSSGLVSGTPTTATTYNFSVTVTVGTQTSVPQALSLVISNLVVTSGTVATGEVGLPFSFRLTSAGGTAPFTWSLASGSNPLPTGLSLNATTGLISGSLSSTAGSPFSGVTVQVTDSAVSANVATQAMTFFINNQRGATNNSELSAGSHYAFLLSGFDANGNPMTSAGSITTDGAGNITGGVMDTNTTDAAPISNQTLLTSTYSVGSDHRGKLTLTTSAGTSTFVIALNNYTSGVAGGGYMTEFDSSGLSLTGTLALQNAAAFNNAALTGGFAFGLSGYAPNSTPTQLNRRGIVGEMQLNGGATVASAEWTSSSAANTTPTVPTSGAIAAGANGRTTLSFVQSAGGGTVNLIAYVVSANQLYLVSSDAANGGSGSSLLFGQALHQTIASGSFDATSLHGVSVVRTEQLDTAVTGGYSSELQLGLYTFNGAGSVNLAADDNKGGLIISESLAGSYTVAGNGRVTSHLSSGFGGCFDCVSLQTFSYLVGANQGFVLNLDPPIATGYFEQQASGTFTMGSLNGPYSTGVLDPLQPTTSDITGVDTSSETGVMTVTLDANAAGTLIPDAGDSETYVVSATGRATLTPSIGPSSVVYIVSPTKALILYGAAQVIQEVVHQ